METGWQIFLRKYLIGMFAVLWNVIIMLTALFFVYGYGLLVDFLVIMWYAISIMIKILQVDHPPIEAIQGVCPAQSDNKTAS